MTSFTEFMQKRATASMSGVQAECVAAGLSPEQTERAMKIAAANYQTKVAKIMRLAPEIMQRAAELKAATA